MLPHAFNLGYLSVWTLEIVAAAIATVLIAVGLMEELFAIVRAGASRQSRR